MIQRGRLNYKRRWERTKSKDKHSQNIRLLDVFFVLAFAAFSVCILCRVSHQEDLLAKKFEFVLKKNEDFSEKLKNKIYSSSARIWMLRLVISKKLQKILCQFEMSNKYDSIVAHIIITVTLIESIRERNSNTWLFKFLPIF